jgi:hypothetical protein
MSATMLKGAYRDEARDRGGRRTRKSIWKSNATDNVQWSNRGYDEDRWSALPKEERDVGAYNSWVAHPVVKIVGEFEASLKEYPPIKVGTPDPYTPPEPTR